MSIRKIKQYSDRGKIQDLTNKRESEAPPLPSELRLKRLYEHAKSSNDQSILKELGFITTDYVEDKTALPLTIFRLRQTVADIKSKSPEIDRLSAQLSKLLFGMDIKYQSGGLLVKYASRKLPIFRRVK
jgi:hypothetical protein